MNLENKNQITLKPNRLIKMSLEGGLGSKLKLVTAPEVPEKQKPGEEKGKTLEKKPEKKWPPRPEDEPGQPEALKKVEKELKGEQPNESVQSRAKTIAEKQKLDADKLNSPAEARENLKNLSVAQARALEVTNPKLLAKACFQINGSEIIFDSGGNPGLEKGVGLRVLPPDIKHVIIDGKSAYRMPSGVFEYADGSGYAKVETGKQKSIQISKEAPPADVVARLNEKTKDYYKQRDLGHFLSAFVGSGDSPADLKTFGEMLNSGKVEGITEEMRKDLQKDVKTNIENQAKIQELFKMNDQQMAELVKQGGNPAIAAEFLKLSPLGLAPWQIAGVIANIKAESNFNPRAFNPAEGAEGICQWRLGRREALYAFAKSHDTDPHSLRAQLMFLVHELQTTESSALAQLKRAQTPEEAAAAFNRYYERSADNSGRRETDARKFYAQMGDQLKKAA
ncbi:MAG: phage tail tip lysozyme [Patescibacteria group bacterium]